ncbi:hypothetical protein Tco_0326011 [Tanacetum coccineum]
MPMSTTFITTGTLLISPSGSLVVTSVNIARTPAITGQVANLVELVALRYTRTIMMVVAFGTFWQRSTILPLLTKPSSVSPTSVLPLVWLLLVLVVSEVIILLPVIFNLTFSQSTEFLIHQIVCHCNSLLHCLGFGRHHISLDHVR